MMTLSSTDTTTDTDDLVVPPSLTAYFGPLLRLADDIQDEHPRAAYLCRFYAFQRANQFESSSSKPPGIKKFKIGLMKRLEQDNATSLVHRAHKSDELEILSFYHLYYESHVRITTVKQLDKADYRARILKAHQTAGLLYQVMLCVVNSRELVDEVPPEIIAAAGPVEEKNEISATSETVTAAQDDTGASETTVQPEEEDKSKAQVQGGETETGWSGKVLKLLKDLLQLKHLRAWFGWLFGRR